MFRTLVVSVVVASLVSGCATMNSRDLKPNGVDPRIEGELFFRGDDEKLDEQEFYQLVGDTESYEAIRRPRAAAQAAQYAWGPLALVGLGAAGFGAANVMLPVGGPLGDQGLFQPIIPTELGFLSYAITGVGIALFATSVAMLTGAPARVNPKTLMFPIDHAIASAQRAGIDATAPAPNSEEGKQRAWEKQQEEAAERDRQRRAKLTNADVAKVVLSAEDDAKTYCGRDGKLKVTFLDAQGKPVDFLEPVNHVTFESEPTGFITEAGEYSSPSANDLRNLGVPLVLRARVPNTKVSAELTLQPELTCRTALNLSAGSPGEKGRHGDDGRDGDRGHINGTSGGNGSPGGNARDPQVEVEAEAVFVKDPRGQSYLLMVGEDGPGNLIWNVVDGDGRINAVGPRGGDGGGGGRGGRGYAPYEDCVTPGDGGNGGDGANGGDGGRGPDLKVRVASAAVEKRLKLSSDGGRGGAGGSNGLGGYAVSQYCSVLRQSSKGVEGRAGRSGARGRDGASGSIDVDIVPAAKLKLVQKLLKGAPMIRLDDDGLDDPVGKGKKR